MFKPFALAFFVAFFVWIGSIVVSTDPQERLHRAATPIALLGKATVALAVQVDPDWATPTYNLFLKMEYGFKYMLWSVFYEDEWRSGQPQGLANASPASPASSATGATRGATPALSNPPAYGTRPAPESRTASTH